MNPSSTSWPFHEWPQASRESVLAWGAAGVRPVSASATIPVWVWAVRLGCARALRLALSGPHAPTPMEVDAWRGWGVDGAETPLFLQAASLADAGCARVLVRYGCTPSVRGSSGRNALFTVRARPVLRALLGWGVAPEIRDASGLDAPAYWAGRANGVFRANDHPFLLPGWPQALPLAPFDWDARRRAVGQWSPQALRRERRRWNDLPDKGLTVAGAVALDAVAQAPADNRIALLLSEAVSFGEDLDRCVDGIPMGCWVALASVAAPMHRVRDAHRSGAAVDAWLFDQTDPRALLQAALQALPARIPPSTRLLLQVRWATRAVGLRGRQARGALAHPERESVEAERHRWAVWGAQALWRGVEEAHPSPAWYGDAQSWAQQVSKWASGCVQCPQEAWLDLLLAWCAHGPSGRFPDLMRHLHRRAVRWSWSNPQSPNAVGCMLDSIRSRAGAAVVAAVEARLMEASVDRPGRSARPRF